MSIKRMNMTWQYRLLDVSIVVCPGDLVPCHQDGMCIKDVVVCDKVKQCPSGEDESDCRKYQWQSTKIGLDEVWFRQNWLYIIYQNVIIVSFHGHTVKPVLSWTLSKAKTCLNHTDFTVPSTKCLCNLNLCKKNTCLYWTNTSVPMGFGLDRFYCI